MTIKSLFDPSKDIYRAIEKVITYNISQEARLKAEISEYVVTESMEDQFQALLTDMQTALEMGPEAQNEIGVWVSGYYGSGKSSFTKYLGLALDDSVTIDGVRFLRHLQDRMHRPQTKALLNTVASRFPAAVIMLDLASEMLAGATMEEVTTVLYYKVLQWAGYSQNLKVAAFERRLERDGRFDEFKALVEPEAGVPWSQAQNDTLVIDSLLPEIAHEMYPGLFRTATSFTTAASEFVRLENERVAEMLDIVREKSGKKFVIFIIDEVGQYIAYRQNLILNMDGLAKNLKNIGRGTAWIIATAQQTLTEDDPRATLNAPELFRLKDRFPIQLDLEADDIKQICYERLLGKSTSGEAILGDLFDRCGQALRYNTHLQSADYYDSDFDRKTFIDLYPFLPAHFDILLHLLGALAKATGGIGLRSAIKVIQDILIEGTPGKPAVADQPVGWLATTVTLYDSLEEQIRRAEPSIHAGVGKVKIQFPRSLLHQDVAKTVAVLQILKNLPVTRHNVASLMHPSVESASRRDAVEAAIRDLISNTMVPFGEKEGNLSFFSERLNEIDQERSQLTPMSIDKRRIQNDALRAAFDPLPSVRLHNSFAVTTGLKAASGSSLWPLAGERETIQTVVEFVDPIDYEATRARLKEQSMQREHRSTIFVVGRSSPQVADWVIEIYQSKAIAEVYKNEVGEIAEYCAAQSRRAEDMGDDLRDEIKATIGQGSLIFRGDAMAAEALDPSLAEALKKHLAKVAEQVFDRYLEAPGRPETSLAEKFLRPGNLRSISSAIDPLGLVDLTGTPRIRTDHKALVSLQDYIELNGSVEGKRLLEYFSDAPFGWSQDMVRYLVAALLVGGKIKLKISGRDVTVNGQQAIDALKTNNSFKAVGVALRETAISLDVLARAAQRLTDVVGEPIIPLEDEINRAAARRFPKFQHRFGPLPEKLRTLGLPGVDTVTALNRSLEEILLTDASDATQRLGAVQSALYDGIKWAAAVETELKNGLETTIRELQYHVREIDDLPEAGLPGELRSELAGVLDSVKERFQSPTFYLRGPDLATSLRSIKAAVRVTAEHLAGEQRTSLGEAQAELQRLPEWAELTQEEQAQELAQLDELVIVPSEDLAGLRRLLSQGYVIQGHTRDTRRRIEQLGRQRRLARLTEERVSSERASWSSTVRLPRRVKSVDELNALIQRLLALRPQSEGYSAIEITFQVED